MKFRALMVVAAGLGMWLVACDFQGAFDDYCARPGRCSVIHDGGPRRQLAQSTVSRQVVVTGEKLDGVTAVELLPSGLATTSGLEVQTGQVSVNVSLNPGVPVGTPLTLQLIWDPARTAEIRKADPFIVTPIVVAADGGNDSTGYGTYDNPYATLARASAQSGSGDQIFVREGRYSSVFPDASWPCDDTAAGLRPGVTVDGEGDASVIVGTGITGTCAFHLSSNDQAVQHVRITGFPEGVRVSDAGSGGGARPRLTEVKIESCGNGVVAAPGSTLLLERVAIRDSTIHGMVLDSADVQVRGGLTYGSAQSGVVMVGSNGSLLLDQVSVTNNSPQSNDSIASAGVLVAADAGSVFIDGGFITANGHTGITISGRASTVAINGALIQSGFGTGIGIEVLSGSAANVYLGNSRLGGSTYNIRVFDFNVFNAGDGDGGWGGNVLASVGGTVGGEIFDARPSNSLPIMTLSRTTIDGGIPPPGTVVAGTAGAPLYGIEITGSNNQIHFE